VKPRKRSRTKSKKIIAIMIIFITIIILISSYWFIRPDEESSNSENYWDPGFDVEALITEEDEAFYNQYPQTPMLYKITKNTLTQTSDITFEQTALAEDDLPVFTEFFDREVNLYNWVVEGAQVTQSIENLAQRILQDVSNDRVEQAKAIFDFVSKYVKYSLDGAYEYPVTTLLEHRGQCSEYATLLTSLYLVAGFKTCYVLTLTEASEYLQLGHIYIALYLPEYNDVSSDQYIITSRLGYGWVGLDATEGRCDFGELFSYHDSHSNIVSIIEPITSLTIYDVEADWETTTIEGSSAVDLNIYLKTWEAENSNSINITFKLYEYGRIKDHKSFSLQENQEKNLEFELKYDSSEWIGEGKQYITINVG
jgi:hypothetical protein